MQRMIGAARLDVPTYEEVEHDQRATGQAAGVVASLPRSRPASARSYMAVSAA